MLMLLSIGPLRAQSVDAADTALSPDPEELTRQQERIDLLLREDWIGEESQRARGFAARLSRALEAPRTWHRVLDQSGRRFEINQQGALRFDPYQGNWRPAIPDLRDAPLHLEEAATLWREGLKEEAMLLWKALRAMSMFEERPSAALRLAAAAAAQRINQAAERDDFAAYDLASDPFVYRADDGRQTVVLSERFSWRLRLDGVWRFMRAEDAATLQLDPLQAAVYLGRDGFALTIRSTIWDRDRRFPALDEFILDRDLKRGLDRQLKEALRFERRLSALHGMRCDTAPGPDRRLRRTSRQRGDGYCAVLESSLSDRYRPQAPPLLRFDEEDLAASPSPEGQRDFKFIEYYLLRPNRGLSVELRYESAQRDQALEIFRSLLETARFGDLYSRSN
ncbi:MAG: hypothetical protein K1X75_01600 [Leptospirales bacterium]|nr:hypothetical protein [Leptospirales bacterium]